MIREAVGVAGECVMMADRAQALVQTAPGMVVEGGEPNGRSNGVPLISSSMQLLSLSWPGLSSVLLGFDPGPSNSTVHLGRIEWFLVSRLQVT